MKPPVAAREGASPEETHRRPTRRTSHQTLLKTRQIARHRRTQVATDCHHHHCSAANRRLMTKVDSHRQESDLHRGGYPPRRDESGERRRYGPCGACVMTPTSAAGVYCIRRTLVRGCVFCFAARVSSGRSDSHSLGFPWHRADRFTPAVTSALDVAEGSRKVSKLGNLFLLPGFTAPGAQECWCLLQNLSVPDIPADDPVSPCSEAGMTAFADWTNPLHPPWQLVRVKFPAEPCTFGVGEFTDGVTISVRATGQALLVRLWRQFQGTSTDATEKADLGFALWERRHWVKVSAIEAYFDDLAARHGRHNRLLLKLRQLWQAYSRGRNLRADRHRQKMVKRLWTGCIEYNREPRQFRTETLLELSYLQYSFEVLGWTPRTSDWVAEVTELDARQPWCNCWIDDPASHPFNTTFAACNPAVPLFVLRGATSEEVAASVVVELTLPASSVSAPWVTQFGDASEEDSKGSPNLGAATS
ncbi:hypothetical protein PR003_g17540 [Phytophthora rubi]|uniref:Uncharacterized protein n=1 Tax=Phytophthora rubi TaxID=129364 RepID=A0A6A4E7K9_9STRA|nr:hypothetical protein PR003_g17540 [Phytophthora rubi]